MLRTRMLFAMLALLLAGAAYAFEPVKHQHRRCGYPGGSDQGGWVEKGPRNCCPSRRVRAFRGRSTTSLRCRASEIRPSMTAGIISRWNRATVEAKRSPSG